MKKLIGALHYFLFFSAFPIIACAATQSGIWQETSTMGKGTNALYVAAYHDAQNSDTKVWGIVYACAVENVLPCTWTATFVATVPSGVINLNTTYNATLHTPVSVYNVTIVFTSATTSTTKYTGCTPTLEPGFTFNALNSGGTGYPELISCSEPIGRILNFLKIL